MGPDLLESLIQYLGTLAEHLFVVGVKFDDYHADLPGNVMGIATCAALVLDSDSDHSVVARSLALDYSFGEGNPFTLHVINQFVYRPESMFAGPDFTPDRLGLVYEDASFAAADGTQLWGWYLPATEPWLALLYNHGNAGDIRDWVHAAPPEKSLL
ncbi:MAG TPA: hypothetical protein VLE70_09455 [Anaerolineae bacterium]|nr:hypothetical protein [Anaerolineae bacterium]